MNVFKLDTVDSTNDVAKRLIASGELHGNGYVLARAQTAGRGSHGRAWASPRDAGIYMTVVRRDGMPELETPLVTLAAGVACAEVLEERTGLSVRLKPINDLFVGPCKLGGILTEASVEGPDTVLIIGIGINVAVAERSVPPGSPSPTCLEALMIPESFSRLRIPAVAADLFARVLAWTDRIREARFGEVLDAWHERRLPGSTIPADLARYFHRPSSPVAAERRP